MHIAFVDIAYGYAADRPEQDEPLGGTTSAVCFLARELAARGVACHFFNKTAERRQAHGITSYPLAELADPALHNAMSAFVFCGRWTEGMVGFLRPLTRAPLIAWMHESRFAAPLTPALDVFDAAVYVSDWQKRANQSGAKPHWRQHVIRNAMNPLAAGLFPEGASVLAAKAEPPMLVYAGSFARGAFHIAPILDALRPLNAGFTAHLFCGTSPSGNAEADRTYIDWLRGQPNIAHVGMTGQTRLLHAMKQASVMVMPNPWPETSCIAMIEAMAAGLRVISTDRAALPETAAGFATLIPIEQANDPLRFDMPIDAQAFAREIAAALEQKHTLPAAWEAERRAQIDYFRAHYQWKQRAAEWMQMLAGLNG